jgi:hypothetical protein
MAACSGGWWWQRKGPRASKQIEGGEMQLQCGWEDRVGGAHREGQVGGGFSRNPVSSTIGNCERASRQ